MEIGLKAQVFNYRMRERRLEMGLTQRQLGDLSEVGITVASIAERLAQPRMSGPAALQEFIDRLHQLADFMEMEFDDAFPGEYIEALLDGRLLRKNTIYLHRDISIDSLEAMNSPAMITNGGLDEYAIQDVERKRAVLQEIDSLPSERQKQVIRLRFGFDCEPMTLEAIGSLLGITKESVRREEAKALREMRHPRHSRKLHEFLT